MALHDTVKHWAKELHGEMVKPHSPQERREMKAGRPIRKAKERIRKMAAKMKHAGYPAKFTSEKEQETSGTHYHYKD